MTNRPLTATATIVPLRTADLAKEFIKPKPPLAPPSQDVGFTAEELEEFERDQKSRAEEGRRKFQKSPGPSKGDDTLTTKPLRPEQTQLKGNLLQPPPSPNFVCRDLLRANDVGCIVAVGGTGKSFFVFQLAYHLAAGRPYGPFEPTGKTPTLVLFAEDSAEIVRERAWAIGAGEYPDGLYVSSIAGEVGPLLELDVAGNPVPSKWYQWIEQTIENHHDIRVLILDPKSRIYGISENDNTHNVIFVTLLEKLAKRYNIAILFTHHTSKLNVDKPTTGMARGGLALEDACRFMAGMSEMSAEEGRGLNVDNKDYVALNIYKLNYAKKPPKTYFLRNTAGTLSATDIQLDRYWERGKVLAEILAADGGEYCRRDILKERRGKGILDALEDHFSPGWKKDDFNPAVDAGIKAKLLVEEEVGFHGRKVIRVVATAK
ncbi:MAG: AAA family ATPase [Deltaproteobacteria bacterium]|nr:AAA family ATPase [Deltaproteobacteria bacterium]